MKDSISENNVVVVNDVDNSTNDYIFVKKGLETFISLPFDKLYGVVCDICDTSPIASGISSDLVATVDMSNNSPNVKHKGNDEIAYFSPEYGNKEDVLNIISLFNMFSSTKLTIYLHQGIHNMIKGFVNENINFITYKDPKNVQ